MKSGSLLPTIHPREAQVREAEEAIRKAINDACRELTTAETIDTIMNVASSEIRHICKYAIRQERHGTDKKPGGEA